MGNNTVTPMSAVPAYDLIAEALLYGERALNILEADRLCGPATGYKAREAIAQSLVSLVAASALLMGIEKRGPA